MLFRSMVTHSREYRWSSYPVNGQGAKSSLISHHPLYLALGQTDTERQAAYRGLFSHELNSGKIDKIRQATNGNFALGDSRFVSEIAEMLGHRVSPGKAGRPRNNHVARK